jgi:hypothetical protein
MTGARNVVAIVFDEHYLGFRELAQQMPIWAIDSHDTRALMSTLWSEATSANNDLTLFKKTDRMSKESHLLSEIATIETHHLEVSTLRIIGVPETQVLREGLAECGYTLENVAGSLLAKKTKMP